MMDITKLWNGKTIDNEPLMVYSASKANTKTGKPYLCAKLGNKTGTIEARMWTLPSDFTLPEVGSIFSIAANVTEFNGQLQLSIKTMQRVFLSNVEDFAIEVDNRPAAAEVNAVIDLIYETLDESKAHTLKSVFAYILDAFNDTLLTHTAACSIHHAGVGGWIKHTLEVVSYAQSIYWALPNHVKTHIRYDILLLGAFLHDIGKLRAYTFENGVPVMTNSGKLLEHIIEGIKIVDTAYKQTHSIVPNTDDKDIQLLEHIIASHHMELEWGSPVNPVTLEAVIVCYADQLSASIDTIYHALCERPADEPWTQKIFTQHNRQFTDSYKELGANE